MWALRALDCDVGASPLGPVACVGSFRGAHRPLQSAAQDGARLGPRTRGLIGVVRSAPGHAGRRRRPALSGRGRRSGARFSAGLGSRATGKGVDLGSIDSASMWGGLDLRTISGRSCIDSGSTSGPWFWFNLALLGVVSYSNQGLYRAFVGSIQGLLGTVVGRCVADLSSICGRTRVGVGSTCGPSVVDLERMVCTSPHSAAPP